MTPEQIAALTALIETGGIRTVLEETENFCEKNFNSGQDDLDFGTVGDALAVALASF